MPGQPSPQPVGTEPMNRTGSRTHQASAVTAQPRRRASVSRETARSVVNVVVSVIGEALASDETVAIAGFGTFSARSRPARRGRAPARASRSPPPGRLRSRPERRSAIS